MSGHGHGGRKGRGKGGGHGGGHEGADERWMVTYADMLTLLLVLFIVLYAISSVNTSKFAELKASLAAAFNNGQPSVLTSGSGIVGGETLATQKQLGAANAPLSQQASKSLNNAQKSLAVAEVDQYKKIEKAVDNALAKSSLGGRAQYSIDERGLVITVVTNDLVFAGNSAVLERDGGRIIDAIAPQLKTVDNLLQVDGHTNQANVSTSPYPSGWELSSARASAVVRRLIESDGMPARRLSAVGYSDQRPLLPASDPRSLTRNRRVDIVVVSKLPPAVRVALPDLAAGAGTGTGATN
jgi:chemotaxis protein MotB